MQRHFKMQSVPQKVPKRQLTGGWEDGGISMCLSCSYTLVHHLLLAIVGSKHCTGCSNLILQLSCLSSYFARNICCRCINISLAPAAALWQNESQQVDSQLSQFSQSLQDFQCVLQRGWSFHLPLFKLRLSLWRGFRGRNHPKCVTGAWVAEFQMLPLQFCLLRTR